MNLFVLLVIGLLIVGIVVLSKKRSQLETKLEQTKNQCKSAEDILEKTIQRYQKYDNLSSTDAYLDELKNEIDSLQAKTKTIEQEQLVIIQNAKEQVYKIGDEIKTLEGTKSSLNADIQQLEEKSYLESFGFYESKYDFDELVKYENALKKIRDDQKKLITSDKAAKCHKEWTVSGSRSAGKKMEKEKLQLMLRAFNGECDAAIAKVKYNNIDTMENRITAAFQKVNRLGQSVECELSKEYLDTKLRELFLVFEFQEKKQQEKEEQRRIKEQMREEERARREIEAELKRTEDEEARYNLALLKAQQELSAATEAQKIKLEAKIKQLEEALLNAELRKERAISRAQMTKSGHVYIISNIGSFGDDVYKIGMTRRLEPEDRVHELGDASVPFPFDIHAMIYCENAPELENTLHKRFHNLRVNQINERKEFFRTSLKDISAAVDEIAKANSSINAKQIQFTMLAEAAEYRKTLAKLRENTSSNELEKVHPKLQFITMPLDTTKQLQTI